MQQLRSVLFYVGLAPVTVLFCSLGVILLPCPRRLRYWVIIQWSRCALWWLKVTCGLRWRVHGTEHIPAQAGVILCKHQSAWETMAMQFIFPPHCQVVKRELLWVPFFGWGLACLNPIAIDRSAGSKALRIVLKAGKERILNGWWVLIFPEGTRTPIAKSGRYSASGTALAIQARCPIVPVAHNAGLFWSRQALRKHPGTIDVVVGPPLLPDGRSASELIAAAEDWIETTCRELPPFANTQTST
ncbi:MAG: 1-acyl-sn-glycerol-3-phosphate acyltransferase [Gammaproteobacteria bacterium]|nr:1-acyl-sn-glycerol-3-phosphate acyltransferase [Gammaproteobacteria bacterium]